MQETPLCARASAPLAMLISAPYLAVAGSERKGYLLQPKDIFAGVESGPNQANASGNAPHEPAKSDQADASSKVEVAFAAFRSGDEFVSGGTRLQR